MAQSGRMARVGPILMFTAVCAFGVGGYWAKGVFGAALGIVIGGLVGFAEVKLLEKLFEKSTTNENGPES